MSSPDILNLLQKINYHSFRRLITLTRIIFTYLNIKTNNNFLKKNTKLLVVRRGGIGDILFVSAILKHIKDQNPSIRITFMADSSNQLVTQSIPAIDRTARISWRCIGELLFNNRIVFLDNKLEHHPDAKKLNIYDLIGEKFFGVYLENQEKRPYFFIDGNRTDFFSKKLDQLSKTKSIRIGVQLQANSPVRTPNLETWSNIILSIASAIPNSFFYILIESKNTWAYTELYKLINTKDTDIASRIINLGNFLKNTSDLFSAIANFDLVVAPDSSVIHIAAGLKIPAIGLYGPFPSALRIAYYENCIGVDAHYPCTPCFTHGHLPCLAAQNNNAIESPCFDQISPISVTKIAISLLENNARAFRNKHHIFQVIAPTCKSETSKFRQQIINIIHDSTGEHISELNGVEIGSGGDPLIEESIVIDFSKPYTKCGDHPIHLKGDSRELLWFKDSTIDYIYSSHVFEDFPENENSAVLAEWTRVIKPGGFLFLLLPDITKYNSYCKTVEKQPNEHHKIMSFGIKYLEELLKKHSNLKIIISKSFWTKSNIEEYNFFIILQKINNTPSHHTNI